MEMEFLFDTNGKYCLKSVIVFPFKLRALKISIEKTFKDPSDQMVLFSV